MPSNPKTAQLGINKFANLDSQEVYRSKDPSGLGKRLRLFPTQCREAWDKVLAFDLPIDHAKVDKVVIAGMGGSSIGGELVAYLVSSELELPLAVCRDYSIPNYFADDKTLVIVCSNSGETTEALSVFKQAVDRKCKVISITTGGALREESKRCGVPVLEIAYKGEPRSAFGYSFIVPLGFLMRLGLIGDKSTEVASALAELDSFATPLFEEMPTSKNPAKKLAQELREHLIVVYGAGIFSGVARRWKNQFNENSKSWAFFEVLPEAQHNSIQGYALPLDFVKKAFVILLKPGFLRQELSDRYHIAQELLQECEIGFSIVQGSGRTPLSQILSTVLLGDYVSYYLAVGQGVDPSPVPAIDVTKQKLALLKKYPS
jgi:glucose/mannose-6-phosphate isomerase